MDEAEKNAVQAEEKKITAREYLDIIHKEVFLREPQSTGSYYLWGGEQEKRYTLIDAWKQEWERAGKSSDVYMFELDLNQFSAKEMDDEANWDVWFHLVQEMRTCLKKNGLNDVVKSSYKYFKELTPAEAADPFERNNAFSKLQNLFQGYSNEGIQMIVLVRHFEKCCEIFPKETEEGHFFKTLFKLSKKGASKPVFCTFLLESELDIEDTVHHMKDISSFPSAYKPVNLALVEKEELESYMKLLQEENN